MNFFVQGSMMGQVKLQPKPKPKPKYQAPKPKVPIQKQQTIKTDVPKLSVQIQPPPQIIQQTPMHSEAESEVQYVVKMNPIERYQYSQIQEPIIGECVVKYSHYKDKFTIKDGNLSSKDIDEKYCLSFVFKGDYRLILKNELKEEMPITNSGWSNVENGKIYHIEVDEDPVQAEIDRRNSKPFTAKELEEIKNYTKPKNKQVDLITEELKQMSNEELLQKGERYKHLIEARDLEDILYK